MWVQFAPNAVEPESWQMYKLGQPISPLDVVYNGSRSLHVVSDEGISVRGTGDGAWEQLNIRSGLTPLLAVALPSERNKACGPPTPPLPPLPSSSGLQSAQVDTSVQSAVCCVSTQSCGPLFSLKA